MGPLSWSEVDIGGIGSDSGTGGRADEPASGESGGVRGSRGWRWKDGFSQVFRRPITSDCCYDGEECSVLPVKPVRDGVQSIGSLTERSRSL